MFIVQPSGFFKGGQAESGRLPPSIRMRALENSLIKRTRRSAATPKALIHTLLRFVLVRVISWIILPGRIKRTIHKITRTNTNKTTEGNRVLTQPRCLGLRLVNAFGVVLAGTHSQMILN
jgi:hypothetical protein